MDAVNYSLERIHRSVGHRAQMKRVFRIQILVRQHNGTVGIQTQLRRYIRRFRTSEPHGLLLVQFDAICDLDDAYVTAMTKRSHTFDTGKLQRLRFRRGIGVGLGVHVQRHGGIEV